MAITQKVFTSRVNILDSTLYVGEAGRLFYAQPDTPGVAPSLRYSDGVTVGGLAISGGGLAATINVGTVSVSTNTVAVTNTGTTSDAYFNFVLQSGPPGPPGSIGVQGPTGAGITIKGSVSTSTDLPLSCNAQNDGYIDTGDSNLYVWTGTGFLNVGQIVGPQGAQGLQGLQGLQGNCGTQGVQGTIGAQGIVGAQGLQGVQGVIGAQGLQGVQGVIGAQGVQGISIQGLQGAQGGNGIQGYIGSQGLQGVQGLTIQGQSGAQGVLGNQGPVGPTGPIGPNIPASVSQLGSVVIGDNINVTPDGTISIPQNIATSSSVIFNDITVNNISVLGTSTYLIPNEVQGYRLYLATSATNTSTINTGGIVLGSSSTGVRSLLWTYNNGNDYWYTDPTTGFQTEHLIASTSTLLSLYVTGQARFGTIYASTTTFSNAPARVDADVNSYAQFMIMNHSADPYASSDVVATANDGSDSSHFIDMGINGTGYSTSSWVINGAGDGYLYIDSGNLAIGTTNDNITFFVGSPETTDSIISVANATTITYSVDLMPSVDAEYLLGRPGQRWKGIYVGTGSVWINDISLGTDAELTVDNGVLYVNGAYQLQVGQLKFFENTIESTTGGTDIQIGLTTSTANLVLNRNTVIATGKSLVFGTGGLQTVAWNSTATVQWSQITGTPAIGVTSITTGTGIRVDHSTGTVNISFANDGGYITSAALATYATQTYVNSQGFITSSALSPYTPTSGLGTIIANSLTNYATQTYVTTRGYISSSSLSVATGSAVSGGALAYSTTTGVFTFNPATAYSLTTATSSALGGVKIGSGINAAGDGTISVTPFNTSTLVAHAVLADTATTSTNAGYAYSFNTGTLVTTAVTANSVAGGYVRSITAGTGTAVSTSTGDVTVWAVSQAITSTGTTTASNYTIDLSGPTFVHWQPSANGNRTITLTGFTPGRKVEVFITPHTTNDIFTVSGVTTSQCSNSKNTFTLNGVGASQQNSFMLQIYCTTNAIGGVWIYGNGSL